MTTGKRAGGFTFQLKRSDLVAPLMTVAAFLPLALPALGLSYSSNDLMNLAYYAERPGEALLSNLLVFTSFHRPSGALVLLPNYWLFGMDAPLLYLLTAVLLLGNATSFSLLLVRLTGDRTLAALAPVPLLFHPSIPTLIYDAGTLYESMAMAGMLASLHCWLSYRTTGSLRWYAAAMGCFLLALNSKETAVVLPVILLTWELAFRNPGRSGAAWKRLLIRTAPLGVVSALYTTAKMWGSEAYWRSNPAYLYDFNPVLLYDHLAAYLSGAMIWIRFGDPELAQAIVVVVLLALLFRSRPMALGLVWFFAALAPVLPLDRIWTIYLYIPLAGLSLCCTALLLAGLRWLRRVGRDHFQLSVSSLGKTVVFGLFLAGVYQYSAGSFTAFLEGPDIERRNTWSELSSQLHESRGQLPATPVIGLQLGEVQESGMFFTAHQLVRLTLGDLSLPVFRLPEQQEAFDYRIDGWERVLFVWRDGALIIEGAD